VKGVGGSLHSPYEFTWKNDFGFEALLWKVFGIEGDYEVCIAGFGASAKRVVLGIGRNLSRGVHFHLFGPFADQVDDFSDKTWTDAKSLQNFLVLVQNIFAYEPYEAVPVPPPVEYIGTWIPAGNKRFSEARYAGHEHARVNDGPRLAFLSFLR
jgi:hypothetical protein